MIIERAAGLFNSLGYYRASLSDLMQATGLEKGGIYNHFSSKDELAIAAFEHAVSLAGARLLSTVKKEEDSFKKLIAFIEGFESLATEPVLPGGCPLLNCAIENDDGNPLLREKVRVALVKLLAFAEDLIGSAQEKGELNDSVIAKELAVFIISSLEGAMMLSRLYQSSDSMKVVAENLKSHLQSLKS